MVFPVAIYGCAIWTIRKAEHWRIDAFKLWCWRRLLKVTCTKKKNKINLKKKESHLYSKKIKPVHPKGNQPWILIGRTNAEAEAPVLWPSDGSWLIGKRPWSWKRLKAKGEEGGRGWDGVIASPTQEHELEQTPGDSEGQGGLACCSPRGCSESDMT